MSFWSHFKTLSSSRTRVAASTLWDQQTTYYQHHGIASWDNKVPYQITNSVYFAHVYAQSIVCYALDCRKKGYEGPIYIVELGASHGQFMFRLIRHLEQILPQHGLQLAELTFFCCDCSDKMIRFWRSQPQLEQYIKKGILRTHLFHINYKQGIECDLPVEKWQDKKIVLIANYFFDSLYQNAFVHDDNKIYPIDVCVPDHTQHGCTTAQLEFVTDKDTPGATFYDNPKKNGILLDHIRDDIQRFLMPDAAMDILDYFSSHTSQVLLLTSDKGLTSPEHHFYSDNMSFHADGAISTTVNFFALDKYVRFCHAGSSVLAPPSFPSDQLVFSSFAFLTHGKIKDYPKLFNHLSYYFQDYSFTDYHINQLILQKDNGYQSIQSVLASFKKVMYDPYILNHLLDKLRDLVENDSHYKPSWLQPALLRLAENNYYIPNKAANCSFFLVARAATILKCYDEAIKLIDIHKDLYGKNYYHFLLMAAYYFKQEDFKESHRYYNLALSQDPDCPESKRYLELCENTIRTQK